MSIFNYWPNPLWEPRDGQRTVLSALESQDWDVACIVAPTGAGKTVLGNTILSWLGDGAYLTPTNMLVAQFRKEYPKWSSLQRKSNYKCAPNKTSCSYTYNRQRRHCRGCPYVKDLRAIRVRKHKVLTYYMYMAHKLKSKNILFDEAHNIIPTVRDLEARKIWRHDVPYPSSMRTVGQLREWLASCPGYDVGFPNDPKLALLRAELEIAGDRRFLIEKGTDYWRGDERELIKLLPLDVSAAKPHLWAGARKLILMSATIGRKDIEELGLDKRRVLYIEAPSPIPATRRPIYMKSLGSFSYKAQGANLPKLASFIADKQKEFPKSKGLVHITYGMRDQLKEHLTGSKYMWHDGANKARVYKEWLMSPPESGRVLMACGMHEGLDLLHDLGRWQVIAKVPWASMADPAISYKAEKDPLWYQWEALKLVVQAAGRICRSPNDYGETTIVDSSFFRIDKNLYPTFFREALML